MGGTAQDEAYRSEIAGALREMMEGFEAAGVIDGRTIRHVDEACLAPAEVLSPEETKAIRERKQLPTCPHPSRVPHRIVRWRS